MASPSYDAENVRLMLEERRRQLREGTARPGAHEERTFQLLRERSERLEKTARTAEALDGEAGKLAQAAMVAAGNSPPSTPNRAPSSSPFSPSPPPSALGPAPARKRRVGVTAESKGSHHVYRIAIEGQGMKSAMVARERYSDLLRLHIQLLSRVPAAAALSFPPKTLMKKSNECVKNRIADFVAYFQQCLESEQIMEYWEAAGIFSPAMTAS